MRPASLGRVAIIVLFVLAVTSGSGYGERPFVSDAHVRRGTVRLLPKPHPSGGPGLGPSHAALVDARHGFIATTGGGHYLAHTGYIRPSQPAEIALTEDGGATWRVLWRKQHVAFDAVAAWDLRHVYAVGEEIRRPYRNPAAGLPRTDLFLLATDNGGERWRRRPLPFDFSYSEPGETGVALQAVGPGEVAVQVGEKVIWSGDGGHTWRRISTPPKAEVVRFGSASTAYAGTTYLYAGRTTCLWRTRDGGRTWKRLRATCGPPVADIEVSGPRVAVAQSQPVDAGPFDPRSVVRLSLDAGATWRIAADVGGRRWPAVVRVHFADARHGWAASQEWQSGWPHEALHRTTNGGVTWQRAWYPVLPIAFHGSRHAWAGDGGSGVLWRTADGARTWHATVRPEEVHPWRLGLGTRTRLIVATDAGTLASRDSGRTWSPATWPSPEALARLRGDLAFVRVSRDQLGDPYGARALLRSGSGWRALRPPTKHAIAAATAFVDQERGVVADGDLDPVSGTFARAILFATQDGGRSWRRIRIPPGARPTDAATLAPGVIVLAWDSRLFVSLDDGSHWQRFRAPSKAFECAADRVDDQAWISCDPSPIERGAFLLTTDDAGRSWTRRRSPIPFDPSIAVTGPGGAWAISSRWGRGAYPHALWRTRDGGRTWRQVWVTVPPNVAIRPASLRAPR